jgi:hypothetical protein
VDRALAGLIVAGVLAVYVAGMFLLDWIVEWILVLTVKAYRRVRSVRASR